MAVAGPTPDEGAWVREVLLGRLRAEPERGWSSARGAVLRTVRTAQRPSPPVLAAPLVGRDADDQDGVLLVSEQVLSVLVGRAVSAALPCVVTDVRIQLVGTELRGVRLRLRAGYGSRLHLLAGQVREVAVDVLAQALGGDLGAVLADTVVVVVDDVTPDDPRSE